MTLPPTPIRRQRRRGDGGTRELVFSVDLSRPHFVDVSMDYGVGGTATAGSDYVAESGTISIPAGETHAEFSFTVNGDTDVEPDEYVYATGYMPGLDSDYGPATAWAGSGTTTAPTASSSTATS